jgi:hypothetical protein
MIALERFELQFMMRQIKSNGIERGSTQIKTEKRGFAGDSGDITRYQWVQVPPPALTNGCCSAIAKKVLYYS